MRLGPFTIARTKALDLQRYPLGSLSGISGSRAWWPLIRDITPGAWQRNEEVQVDTVLSNPTLYSCVTLIAGDIAKLRPMLVEQDDDGIWSEVESAAFSPVLRQPNSYQTWIDFAEWYQLSKLVHGNAYALKARDNRNVVTALYILDPYRVTPLVAPDGSVFYQLAADPLADLEQSVVVPAREMIHDVMCPLFHPLCGVSPIYAAGFPAIQGLNIRGASDKFFRNGSRPGGILLVPGNLSQPQADEMKANWKDAFSGDNQGDVAVLTGGMKYEPMAMTAEQSRLVDQLRMTDEDIAKCFHMPRHKVGVGPDPTYTNIEAKNRDYYTDCLQKHIVKFQTKLTTGLEMDRVSGKTLAVELDLDDLLMMDTAAKADAASKAVTAGLSYNEARLRFWDVGPVDGGESPLAQQQNYSLQALARRDASANPFGTSQPPPAAEPAPAEKAGPMGPAGPMGLAGKDGRDGVDGKDGAPGFDGKDGRDGLTGTDGAAGLHGKDGRDGLPGVPGRDGERGADGLDGKDGAPGLKGKDGTDGLAGKDGADGLGFEDLSVDFDEQRGVLVRFVRDGLVKEFPIPVPFDAGVWEHGRPYPKGAGVTRNGAFWIAQAPTSARPGDPTEDARAWRLSVKGGRDGKPGRDGKDGVSS